MTQFKGWTGKILEVDLSEKKTHTILPPREIYLNFLGGRALAGHYLRENVVQGEIPLIFMTGPLTGTGAPSSDFFSVMTKSPLTETVSDISRGGNFGIGLKQCGFDGLIIRGESSSPIGLEITGREINFHNAQDLEKMNFRETAKFCPTHKSLAVTTGAAHEGVLFSNISFDDNSLDARGGMGYAMAKRGLKYIALNGEEEILCHDPKAMETAAEDIYRLTSASPILKGELGFGNMGTATLFDLIQSRRMMPVNNFRETFFEGGEHLNAFSLKKTLGHFDTEEGSPEIKYSHLSKKGEMMPSYESLASLTAMLGNRDQDAMMESLKICNEEGLDPVSASSTLACFMEIENIPQGEMDIPFTLRGIARGEERFSQFKGGADSLAQDLGSPERAMTVKGLEIPPFDPRGALGLALSLATSNRGACHFSAYPLSYEILRKPVALDRFSFTGKARIIKVSEDINAAADSLGICKYIMLAASLEEYTPVLNAVTGENFTPAEVQAVGERAFYNERIINSSPGFVFQEEALPERFFMEEGSSGGGMTISPIDRDEFQATLERYYRIRNLSSRGLPLDENGEEISH